METPAHVRRTPGRRRGSRLTGPRPSGAVAPVGGARGRAQKDGASVSGRSGPEGGAGTGARRRGRAGCGCGCGAGSAPSTEETALARAEETAVRGNPLFTAGQSELKLSFTAGHGGVGTGSDVSPRTAVPRFLASHTAHRGPEKQRCCVGPLRPG